MSSRGPVAPRCRPGSSRRPRAGLPIRPSIAPPRSFPGAPKTRRRSPRRRVGRGAAARAPRLGRGASRSAAGRTRRGGHGARVVRRGRPRVYRRGHQARRAARRSGEAARRAAGRVPRLGAHRRQRWLARDCGRRRAARRVGHRRRRWDQRLLADAGDPRRRRSDRGARRSHRGRRAPVARRRQRRSGHRAPARAPARRTGERLAPTRFAQLVLAARAAKEALLSRDNIATEATVTLLGQGSKLVSGSKKTTLARVELEQILDGFFPKVDRDARPSRTRAGLVAFGLPYASDPAVTRHLAQFLARHVSGPPSSAAPGVDQAELHVLLNGGAFHAGAIVERVLASVEALTGRRPTLLSQGDPDLSVARGAAVFALAARGEGRAHRRRRRALTSSAARQSTSDTTGDAGRRWCGPPCASVRSTGEWQIVTGRTFGLVTGRTARFDALRQHGRLRARRRCDHHRRRDLRACSCRPS